MAEALRAIHPRQPDPFRLRLRRLVPLGLTSLSHHPKRHISTGLNKTKAIIKPATIASIVSRISHLYDRRHRIAIRIGQWLARQDQKAFFGVEFGVTHSY